MCASERRPLSESLDVAMGHSGWQWVVGSIGVNRSRILT